MNKVHTDKRIFFIFDLFLTMHKISKHYSVEMTQIELTSDKGKGSRIYPLMDIVIHGVPSLPEIIRLMGDIKKEIKEIKGDYISVTDLTKLSISQFLSRIILKGMERAYKSALGVGRASIISFVVLSDKQEYAAVLSNTLQNINDQKVNTGKDYKYRYYFVKSKEEIKPIAEQIVM